MNWILFQIKQRKFTWVILIGMLLCHVQADSNRWSRQTLNSEWIPLTHPKNSQLHQSTVPAIVPLPPPLPIDSSAQGAGQVPAVALPPALQTQYQDQIQQLQKTQESIQRILLLQQQLKAQQQLLQVNYIKSPQH